jgi:hypothetical protein
MSVDRFGVAKLSVGQESWQPRRGLIGLVIVNVVVAIGLILLCEVVTELDRKGQLPRGMRQVIMTARFASMTALSLAAAIPAALMPSRRWIGMGWAITAALTLGIMNWLAAAIRSPESLTVAMSASFIGSQLPTLFVFVTALGLRNLLHWRMVLPTDRNESCARQFSLLDLIEWMVAISMFCALGTWGGWLLHPSLVYHLAWQTLISLPLALAIVSTSPWRTYWILTAMLVALGATVAFELRDSHLMGVGPPSILYVAFLTGSYVVTIGLNFLALRWLGYRLIIPTTPPRVAANEAV